MANIARCKNGLIVKYLIKAKAYCLFYGSTRLSSILGWDTERFFTNLADAMRYGEKVDVKRFQ